MSLQLLHEPAITSKIRMSGIAAQRESAKKWGISLMIEWITQGIVGDYNGILEKQN